MHFTKKWIGILCWICIFLCAGFLTKTQASAAFNVADSLFEKQQYYAAAIEYERLGFTANNNNEKTLALIKKSNCLNLIGKYEDAARCMGRVNYNNLPDTLIYKSKYQYAISAYLAKDFGNAESQLLQMQFFVPDSNITYTALPLFCLILNEQQKWAEAKIKLMDYVRLSPSPQATKDSIYKEIELMYATKAIPKMKSLKKAQTLSYILPGTGQMYAGYFWEGAASAAIQLAALSLTAYCVYVHYYVAAFVGGYSIFSKFYLGGINRLEYLVGKTNYERSRKFNDIAKEKTIGFQEKLQ